MRIQPSRKLSMGQRKFQNKKDAINARIELLDKLTTLVKIDKGDGEDWVLLYPDSVEMLIESSKKEISQAKSDKRIELSNDHFCITCGNPLPVERVKLLGEKIRCLACQKRAEDPPISSPENNPNHAATTCHICGSKLKLYKGPYGPFYGCSNFPRCPGKN